MFFVAAGAPLGYKRSMIYSQFGTRVTLHSKSEDESGQICLWAVCEGMEGPREYRRRDLKADGGGPEIDAAIAALPWKNKAIS